MSFSFLQSPEWEEFQKSVGHEPERVEGTLVLTHYTPLGWNYLYCPRPEIASENFFSSLGEYARDKKSIFAKIDHGRDLQVQQPFPVRNVSSIQPQQTRILGLEKDENDILNSMHEKTRYNIRLALKKGVTVSRVDNPEDPQSFETFYTLLSRTAKRDTFRLHPRAYYEGLTRIRSPYFSNELFIASHGGTPLAAALVNFHSREGMVTYLHGGSERALKEVMAPHLLHWKIIEEAKHRGFEHYDFWGIDSKRWPGITRFKEGFGGESVSYPNSVDILYRPSLYYLYRAAKRFLS